MVFTTLIKSRASMELERLAPMVGGSQQCLPQLLLGWVLNPQGSFRFSLWIGAKANWVASSFEEKRGAQYPTVRMGNRQAGDTRKGERACRSGRLRTECRWSLPPFHSFRFMSPVGAGRAEAGELACRRCVCVCPHPKMSNHRLPLDSWQQRENKTTAAFIAENTELSRSPNEPDGRALFLGGKAQDSRPRSRGRAVGPQTAHRPSRWRRVGQPPARGAGAEAQGPRHSSAGPCDAVGLLADCGFVESALRLACSLRYFSY